MPYLIGVNSAQFGQLVGDVLKMTRLRPILALRLEGLRGGVGLQHDVFQRESRGDRLKVRETEKRLCQRDVETQVDGGSRRIHVALEVVHRATDLVGPLLPEDAYHLIVRLTAVEDDGQPKVSRQSDLLTEAWYCIARSGMLSRKSSPISLMTINLSVDVAYPCS